MGGSGSSNSGELEREEQWKQETKEKVEKMSYEQLRHKYKETLRNHFAPVWYIELLRSKLEMLD